MTPRKGVSIKRKLTSITMLTSAVTLMLVCGAFLVYELSTFRENATGKLVALAGILGDNSAAALAFEEQDAADKVLASLQKEEDIASACIFSADGEIFAKFCRGYPYAEFEVPEFHGFGFEFEKDSIALYQPVTRAGKTIGTIYLKSNLRDLRGRWERTDSEEYDAGDQRPRKRTS